MVLPPRLEFFKRVFFPEIIFTIIAMAIPAVAAVVVPSPGTSITYNVIAAACIVVVVLSISRIFSKAFPVSRSNSKSNMGYAREELYEWMHEEDADEAWGEIKAKIARTMKIGSVIIKIYIAIIVATFVYVIADKVASLPSGSYSAYESVSVVTFFIATAAMTYFTVLCFVQSITNSVVRDVIKRLDDE